MKFDLPTDVVTRVAVLTIHLDSLDRRLAHLNDADLRHVAVLDRDSPQSFLVDVAFSVRSLSLSKPAAPTTGRDAVAQNQSIAGLAQAPILQQTAACVMPPTKDALPERSAGGAWLPVAVFISGVAVSGSICWVWRVAPRASQRRRRHRRAAMLEMPGRADVQRYAREFFGQADDASSSFSASSESACDSDGSGFKSGFLVAGDDARLHRPSRRLGSVHDAVGMLQTAVSRGEMASGVVMVGATRLIDC